MLSYPLSILSIIVFIVVGIIWLFRKDFPPLYRFLGVSGKLGRRGIRASVDRLGCLRALFWFYIGFAVIFSLILLITTLKGQNWLPSLGQLGLVWMPVLILRYTLRWLSARKKRHFQLPRR